jgi:outer membrane lipoprotein SlyB
MSDSGSIGFCTLSSTTSTSVQGSNQGAITNIQVNVVGGNAPAGTTLTFTDGSGAFVATFALALPTALLAAYFGNIMSMDNLALPIAFVNSPVTVKLNNALSSGVLSINVGYEL